VNNTTTTGLNIPSACGTEGTRETQWTETRAVFSIYLALAKHLKIEVPFPPALRTLPETPSSEFFDQVQAWLDHLDQKVMVYELRQLLQMTTLNASESGLRSLIQRHLRKSAKTTFDRDKVDFLLVQYFALCAAPKIYHKQIELPDVAEVLRPVLGEVDTTPLPWCARFETMIEALREFTTLRELLKTNFIEQGRSVKESSGDRFYDPSALIAFVRFNFLLRRALIELMHADLIAIRAGLSQLESDGVRVMNCKHFGLSDAEPLHKVREIANEWKQPFQGSYTERSVSQAFEKLLGLRADVEQALEKMVGRTVPAAGNTLFAKPVESPAQEPPPPQVPEKPEPGPANAAPTALDFETCMEKIWEQLIATPPSRGRSMTTVKIGGVRILMSSWEVAAFVTEHGPVAEDLRSAVVVRVLVSSAVEAATRTGATAELHKALSVARGEVSRLQERVEAAKKVKDTEAAVNLGISTKRLLSVLDQAEKL
jgi:hypothetical protein